MDLVSHVTILGGACARRVLVERCGRAAVDAALKDGTLLRVARGRYALRTAGAAVVAAATLDVTFPRTRHLHASARELVTPHWSDIAPEDVVDGMTGVRRTLVDCMRMLPLDESLPIVDSALRIGDVTPGELQAIARSMRG